MNIVQARAPYTWNVTKCGASEWNRYRVTAHLANIYTHTHIRKNRNGTHSSEVFDYVPPLYKHTRSCDGSAAALVDIWFLYTCKVVRWIWCSTADYDNDNKGSRSIVHDKTATTKTMNARRTCMRICAHVPQFECVWSERRRSEKKSRISVFTARLRRRRPR